MIIHISGASGSGKTTMGNNIKKKYKNKIIVKDLDDLFLEFMNEKGYNWNKKFNPKIYQKYINDFINKQHKPIIFVGLNMDMWHNPEHYYDVKADYKFYIDMDIETIFKQKCERFIRKIFGERINDFLENVISNEKETMKRISEMMKKYECSFNAIKKINKKRNKDYKKMGYNFMNQKNIYQKIFNIL